MGYAQVQRSEPNVIEQNAFGKYIMTLSQSWVKLGNVHAGIGFLVVKIKLTLMNIENIKFKAKCLDNDKWAEGSLVTTKLLGWDEPMTEIVAIDGTRYEVDPSTVCQFTGMKDKTGNDVWEGDLVRESYELLDIDNLYEVIYIEEDGAFAFKCINKADNYEPYINVADTVVVGNKFDN